MVSEKQRRFMYYCLNNPEDPKCPPPSVVKEFLKTERLAKSKKQQARRDMAEQGEE
jgi:hypothetical protein